MNPTLFKDIPNKTSAVQIALDDVWEKAWIIQPPKRPILSDIEKYLTQPHKLVNVETIYHSSDGTYIFGLDYIPQGNNKDPKFIDSFIQQGSNPTSFNHFLEILNQSLPFPQEFFNGFPDIVRIGVVNHWFSIGPIALWQKGNPLKISRDELNKILQSNPLVSRSNLNYQGMSFVYNLYPTPSQICYWVKAPCSHKENGYWQLDSNLIRKYLQRWLNIQIS